MIDLNHYFDPVSISGSGFDHLSGHSSFPYGITIHTENFPVKDIPDYAVAIVGVPDGRSSPGPGTAKACDSIRTELYRLARIPGKKKVIDLGNMKPGTTFNDTVAGLTDIIDFLLQNSVVPVVIGGSSTLTLAIDRALTVKGDKYTLLCVDSRIDFINEKKEAGPYNYLYSILHSSKSAFGHYVNIGYQTYLNDQQVINRFMKKGADLIRIGDVRKAIHLTEPLFRDSETAIFDMSAVRQPDAPGTWAPSPNGFYGEEICLLSRYAGISDNMKVFGLFDVNPDLDNRAQTSALAAQVIWFFLEGFSQKQYETPSLGSGNQGRFIKYHVRVTDYEDDIVFIRSNHTDRWWIELSTPDGAVYMACSQEDYHTANRNEIPERLLRGLERIK